MSSTEIVKVKGTFLKGKNYCCGCGTQLMGRPDFQPRFCHCCGRQLNWYDVTDYEEAQEDFKKMWDEQHNHDKLVEELEALRKEKFIDKRITRIMELEAEVNSLKNNKIPQKYIQYEKYKFEAPYNKATILGETFEDIDKLIHKFMKIGAKDVKHQVCVDIRNRLDVSKLGLRIVGKDGYDYTDNFLAQVEDEVYKND